MSTSYDATPRTGPAVADPDVAEPLGPDSLSWRYFGLWLGFVYGSVPQLLQVMHPVLGHAVEEHSNVKEDPFDRLIRSMGPIYGVVYDGPAAEATAVAVRSYHEQIRGTLPNGERYSGLNPEVFHWAHATFVHGLVYGFSELLGPFTREQQEQLYAESRQWYRLYGMTMRNVPETLDEFDRYWEHYLDEVVEVTPAAQWLLATFRSPPQPPGLTWVPDPLWRPMARVGGYVAVVAATGRFPEGIRLKLGLRYGAKERLLAHAVRQSCRTAVRLCPPQYRYHPRPLAGWKREAEARGVPLADLVRGL